MEANSGEMQLVGAGERLGGEDKDLVGVGVMSCFEGWILNCLPHGGAGRAREQEPGTM